MQPVTYQGKLIKWKDDRGFGFISSEGESKEIFLHISALTGASRRPKVGDVIFYEKAIGKDGKLSAVKASIQGVAPRTVSKEPYKSAPKRSKSKLPILGSILGVGLAASGAIGISTNRNLFNFNTATSPQIANPTVVKSAAPIPKATNTTAAKPSTVAPKKVVIPKVTKPTVAATQKVASPAVAEPSTTADCSIKGNISFSSGKKFYHLEGMPEYEMTEIDISKGERYFCSESEAIANGWSKAPR